MPVYKVSSGIPFSMKLLHIHSAGCVLYTPIPGGLIGPDVALVVALPMCLCSTESKPFIAAVVSLGQHMSNGELTVVLKKNLAFIVWNSRHLIHFDHSLRSWQAICTVAGTEKMTLFKKFFLQ